MRTLPYTLSVLELLEERAYTAGRLAVHPLTTAWAPDFDPIRTELLSTQQKEVVLIEAVARARAQVFFVDNQLDRLLIQIVNTLLSVVQNDRQNPLYVRFLGGESPSRLSRPVLGEQLKLMRTWVDLLFISPHSELKLLYPALESLVTQGQQAETAYIKARSDLETYYSIGDYKDVVDALNALRKATYGKLGELVHKLPAENLPSDFPETFFLRESRQTEPTLDSVEQQISRLGDQLKKLNTLRDGLIAEEELQKKKKADAEAQLLRAELEALEKDLADKKARAESIKRQLGSG